MAFQEAFTIGIVLSAKDYHSSILHKAERDLRNLRKISKETVKTFEAEFM